MEPLSLNDQTPGMNAGARAEANAAALARCALLTPHGAGAVAAIRVCGSAAWDAVRSCLRNRDGDPPRHIEDDKLWFGQFHDGADALDDVIVAVGSGGALGPIVDITCHGGVRIVERILLALSRRGAAVVQGGELNDAAVVGAGAVERDVAAMLPRCSTQRGAKYVLRQRTLLTAELNRIAGQIEAGCDDAARAAMRELLDRGRVARVYCDPPSIALVGPVNAGKSSWANRLAGRDDAIVADRPGTTRDWVTIDANLDGVPVTLVDTPGRAADPDDLEREAISRGERLAREARVRMLVLDAARLDAVDPAGWLNQADHPVAVAVINKVDRATPPAALVKSLAAKTHVVQASALTGEGVPAVRAAIVGSLGFTDGFDSQPAAFGPLVQAGIADVLADASPLQAAAAVAIRRLAAWMGA